MKAYQTTLACGECGRAIHGSYDDRKNVHTQCTNVNCEHYGVRYKLPTVELEPVEPFNIRDELDIDFSPNPPESDPATYRHECGCERVVDGTRGQFSVFGQQFNALCIDAVNMHGAIERTGSLLEHIAAIDAGYKASRKRQQDDTVWIRGPYGLQGSASYKAKTVKDEQQEAPADPIPVHVSVDEGKGDFSIFKASCGCVVVQDEELFSGPMLHAGCDERRLLLRNGMFDEASKHANVALSEHRDSLTENVAPVAPPQPNDDRPETTESEVEKCIREVGEKLTQRHVEMQKRCKDDLEHNFWENDDRPKTGGGEWVKLGFTYNPDEDVSVHTEGNPLTDSPDGEEGGGPAEKPLFITEWKGQTADEHTLGKTEELPVGKWWIQTDSEVFGADNGSPCPDCKGEGKYHGLNAIEDCGTCRGTGRV